MTRVAGGGLALAEQGAMPVCSFWTLKEGGVFAAFFPGEADEAGLEEFLFSVSTSATEVTTTATLPASATMLGAMAEETPAAAAADLPSCILMFPRNSSFFS